MRAHPQQKKAQLPSFFCHLWMVPSVMVGLMAGKLNRVIAERVAVVWRPNVKLDKRKQVSRVQSSILVFAPSTVRSLPAVKVAFDVVNRAETRCIGV